MDRFETRDQARQGPSIGRGVAGFILLALLALVIAPGALAAQAILNTERFQLGEVEGRHASVDASGSLKRGNSEVLDLSASGMVGVMRDRHWPRLIFGGQYLSDEERSILDQQFAQLRYSYIFSDRLTSFHFVQAQKNETLLLQSRWLVGSGLRWELYRSERTELAAGTGLMAESERLDRSRLSPGESWESDRIRVANLAVFSRELESGARILNIVYLQPDVGELSNLRVLNELGLFIPLTDRLRTTAALEWRRDTRPPADLGRDDLNLRVGLGLEIL